MCLPRKEIKLALYYSLNTTHQVSEFTFYNISKDFKHPLIKYRDQPKTNVVGIQSFSIRLVAIVKS